MKHLKVGVEFEAIWILKLDILSIHNICFFKYMVNYFFEREAIVM